MSDALGTEPTDAGAPAPAAPGPAAPAEPTPAGGGNPAWDSLRSEVGDATFHLLQPHLKKWDDQASQRVAQTNAELKRYTELGDYDNISAGASLVQQLEADPLGFLQNYTALLQERGLLDAEVDEGVEGDEDLEDPRDARIAALEEALEQIQGQTQEQSTQRQIQQWNDEWQSTFEAAREQNPWLTEDDDRFLRRLAADHIQSNDDAIPDVFGKALADLSNSRNRYLSAPRANESAPRLIQAGGGNPAAAAAQPPKPGQETRDIVARYVQARRG